MDPALSLDRASIFFDGTLRQPQLNHPEGLAIDREGAIWCGGTAGEIYRIAADGSAMHQIGSTQGLILGLAIDHRDLVYACDIFHRTVFRIEPASGRISQFAKPRGAAMVKPNYPVVDLRRNCLYVSDSNARGELGMGIWRFDLDTGDGDLWWSAPMDFANGMALSSDGTTLYVAETYGRRLCAVQISEDGSAVAMRTILDDLDGILDGLALAGDGTLYLSYFGPSKITRLVDGEEQLVITDPWCDILSHPTNIAWRGEDLFVANLGAFHVTRIELGIPGQPLLAT